MLSLKASNPLEAYDELRQAVEDSMAPPEPIPPERKAWYDTT